MEFTNKVALITGASTGIGKAVALQLAEDGATLILLDVNFEKLETVKQELKPLTEQVYIYRCDISNEALVKDVVADALTRVGKIDILINNAAIWRSFYDFIDLPTEEVKRIFDVNVMGTFYTTQAVLPGMIEQGYGKILNVASVAGVYGNARMSHYSASKAAVIAMTQALAKEMAGKGILVNAVSPGTVSPAERDDMDYSEPNELSHLGRTGTDRENANLICFLVSDKASYVTGQNIQIDGCRKKI